jgi:hypothetical protein
VAYGTYEAAQLEDFINRIFLTGGISTGKQAANPLADKIRDAVLQTYTMTGLPLRQIEEGILTGTRGLAGIPLQERLELMPGLLAASATEAYLKEGTTVPQAMQAFVGLAHMQGKYSPEEIAKLAGHFAYLSTTTPVSVEQVERAAGYAIPMLRTADFDPAQLLLMITSMERAGIMNTKAGTWISQLGMQSFPGTSLMSKALFHRHEAALKSLGLIDKHDQPTWFTDSKPDLVKMTEIAGEAIAKMEPKDRLAVEKALWGQQGGRAAGFFADPTNRRIMGAVAAEEKYFISGEAQWEQSLENSPIVQMRTSFAELNVELIKLGQTILPTVTSALRGFNELLNDIKNPKDAVKVTQQPPAQTWGEWLSRFIPKFDFQWGTPTSESDREAAHGRAYQQMAARTGLTAAPWAMPWSPASAGYKNQAELAREMGRESQRGIALSGLPGSAVAPAATPNVTVNIHASINGHDVAVAIEQEVLSGIIPGITAALRFAGLANLGGGSGALDSTHTSGGAAQH